MHESSKFLLKSDGSRILGVCDTKSKTIHISSNIPNEKYKVVLTHELIHAYIYEFGIKIPEMEEERVANMVAEHIGEISEIVKMVADENKKG